MRKSLICPAPFYLTIGVTGHRDIPPEAEDYATDFDEPSSKQEFYN